MGYFFSFQRPPVLKLFTLAALIALVGVNAFLIFRPHGQVLGAASPNYYYVSSTGNDTNPGTSTQPFLTFQKAFSVMQPGDHLRLYGGVYTEQMRVRVNGNPQARTYIYAVEGQTPVLDGTNRQHTPLVVSGSFIDIDNLEVRGSRDICVNVTGSHIRIFGFIVHDCPSHGINVTGEAVVIEGNTLYNNALSNQGAAGGGWGSALKASIPAHNVVFINNHSHSNWGEGIAATRASSVQILHNTFYNNFASNIYIDNSYRVEVNSNFVYCTADNSFLRNGLMASGITIGEEFYANWGAQLSQVRVVNNIVTSCDRGITAYAPEMADGGLKYVMIAHNTLWGSRNTAISISSPSRNITYIINNLVQQPAGKVAWLQSDRNIFLGYNFWVGSQPGAWTRANGVGDRWGDPLLTNIPGVTAESFQPSILSPAVGAAVPIPEATHDFFGRQRHGIAGLSSDIGAVEL